MSGLRSLWPKVFLPIFQFSFHFKSHYSIPSFFSIVFVFFIVCFRFFFHSCLHFFVDIFESVFMLGTSSLISIRVSGGEKNLMIFSFEFLIVVSFDSIVKSIQIWNKKFIDISDVIYSLLQKPLYNQFDFTIIFFSMIIQKPCCGN